MKLEDVRAKRAAAALMLQQIALNPRALSDDVAELYRRDFREASAEQERLQSELNALLRSSDEVQALVQREAIALLRCLLREYGADTHETTAKARTDRVQRARLRAEAEARALLAKQGGDVC
jgi:hypothetical protein